MASGWFSQGLLRTLDGTIDLDTSTLKLMLVDTGYTYDPDHEVVDPGTNDAADLSHNEVVATNYTGGFGGAGRKTAVVTMQKSNASNRVEIAIGDLTWTSLGGATNDTVGGSALIREITNDTQSIPIGFFDVTDTPTNGGNVTLDFAALAAGGNMQIAV